MIVEYIVYNQIPIFSWSRVPRRFAVVFCISMDQYFYALWMLTLLVFQYISKYGLIQIQVG